MGLCCSDIENERQLRQLVAENSLSTCIVTWNVNAKEPSDTFGQLLIHRNISFDIYVVGLQEIVDLNAKNLIIHNHENTKWETAVESILNKQNKSQFRYIKLSSIGLVGILLMVYIKESLLDKINPKNILSAKCASGLFDIAGNKGGVGIRFEIYNTSLCFVCSHLAAHKHNVKGRNEDYHKIIQKLVFSEENNNDESDEKYSIDPRELEAMNALTGKELDSKIDEMMEDLNIPQQQRKGILALPEQQKRTMLAQSKQMQHQNHESSKKSKKNSKTSSIEGISILQHDIVYFLGDLNYRLEFDEIEQVYQLINQKKWSALLSGDQLLTQIEKGLAFADFNESKILFRPTFKYEPGTNEYEQIKKRIPSWCDRILWKVNKKKLSTTLSENETEKVYHKQKIVKCIRYNCCLDEMMSDHKPVYGLFKIEY